MIRKEMLICCVLLLLILIPSVLAANNPGHDTLYIEETGNSTLTGTLNVSHELGVSNLIKGGTNLDILGNGSQPGNSLAEIYATSGNALYFNAPGNFYFGVTGGGSMVYLGTSGVHLNVSGNIYSGGELVCLADGTNCAGGNNTGNVTSIIAGNGLSIDQSTGDVNISISAPTCAGDEYSYWTGTAWNCRTDQDSGGSGDLTDVLQGSGITVTSSSGPQPNVSIDATYTQRRVSSSCGANQAIRIIAEDGTVTCGSTGNMSAGSGWYNNTQMTFTDFNVNITSESLYLPSGDIFASGSVPSNPAYTFYVDRNTGIYNPAADNIGFSANGGEILRINTSGAFVSNSQICTPTNGLCNQTVVAAAGWTNTSTTTYTDLHVNITTGNLTIANGMILAANGQTTALSYSFASDPDTGYYRPDSDMATFVAGAQEALTIRGQNGYGQIGIGANPEARLHILNEHATEHSFRVDDEYQDGSPFVINATGSVGIGTTSPTQLLDVNGSVNITGSSGKVHTPELCLNGDCQTAWPSGTDGTGGWTNTTTETNTSLRVNIKNNLWLDEGYNLTMYFQGTDVQALSTETGVGSLVFGANAGVIMFPSSSVYHGSASNQDVTFYNYETNAGDYIPFTLAEGTTGKVYFGGADWNTSILGSDTRPWYDGGGGAEELALLSDVTGGSADGTGGWMNTSTFTYTNLEVNISDNFWANSTHVGIGTTNPNTTLDVVGTINATGDVCTDQAGGLCLSTVGSGAGGWTASGGWTNTSLNVAVNSGTLYLTGTGPALVFNETDNVPWRYVVDGDQWIVQRDGSDMYVVTQNTLYFKQQTMTNNDDTEVAITASAANSELRFGANNTHYLYLRPDGTFGLNEPTPVFTLEIVNQSSNGGFAVSTSDGAAGDIFVIDESGNVGINTNNPTKRLEVSDGTKAITFDPITSTPTINTTSGNLTIDSAGGYVIINLG